MPTVVTRFPSSAAERLERGNMAAQDGRQILVHDEPSLRWLSTGYAVGTLASSAQISRL